MAMAMDLAMVMANNLTLLNYEKPNTKTDYPNHVVK
jgi:hypothetical protein